VLKTKLQDKLTTFGCWISIGNPEVTEILSLASFDWFLLDMEHAPMTISIVENLLQTTGEKITPLVRVPLNNAVPIKQALDIGAHGVMIPMVNTAEDAQSAVSGSKYPPDGSRGIGARRVSSYFTKHKEYILTANEETMVIPQIETKEAIRNFETIINTNGIDAWFIGPGDLAASLGHAGETNSPAVTEAMDSLLRIGIRNDVPGGTLAFSVNAAKEYVKKGYTLISLGSDTAFLLEGAETALKEMKKVTK
jgi:2-dehydro-3-deoxyglucarate aldolase